MSTIHTLYPAPSKPPFFPTEEQGHVLGSAAAPSRPLPYDPKELKQRNLQKRGEEAAILQFCSAAKQGHLLGSGDPSRCKIDPFNVLGRRNEIAANVLRQPRQLIPAKSPVQGALLQKLDAIRDVLRSWPFKDPISEAIAVWETEFRKALSASPTPQTTSQYLQKLQDLLAEDPLYFAPYDTETVYSPSQEMIYSGIGLDVYCLNIRSQFAFLPTDERPDPTPQDCIPHLVVRHMVGFLAEYGMQEYSQVLLDEKTKLIEEEQRFDTTGFARTLAEHDLAEQALLEEGDEEIAEDLAAELAKFEALASEVKEGTETFSRAGAAIISDSANDHQQLVSDFTTAMKKQREQGDRVDGQLRAFRSSPSATAQFQEVSQEIQARMAHFSEKLLNDEPLFAPFESKRQDYIDTMDKDDREIQARADQLHQMHDRMDARLQALDTKLVKSGQSLSTLERQVVELNQGMAQTEAAIAKAKKKSNSFVPGLLLVTSLTVRIILALNGIPVAPICNL